MQGEQSMTSLTAPLSFFDKLQKHPVVTLSIAVASVLGIAFTGFQVGQSVQASLIEQLRDRIDQLKEQTTQLAAANASCEAQQREPAPNEPARKQTSRGDAIAPAQPDTAPAVQLRAPRTTPPSPMSPQPTPEEAPSAPPEAQAVPAARRSPTAEELAGQWACNQQVAFTFTESGKVSSKKYLSHNPPFGWTDTPYSFVSARTMQAGGAEVHAELKNGGAQLAILGGGNTFTCTRK